MKFMALHAKKLMMIPCKESFNLTWRHAFYPLRFTVLMGLGTWQVKRLAWKTDLLAHIENQMRRPPVRAGKISDAAAWEYRRVTLAGHFLYDHEF